MDPTWLRERGRYLRGIPAERPYQPVLASAEAAILGFDLEQAADQWDKDRAEIERLKEGLRKLSHNARMTLREIEARNPNEEAVALLVAQRWRSAVEAEVRNLLESNNEG